MRTQSRGPQPEITGCLCDWQRLLFSASFPHQPWLIHAAVRPAENLSAAMQCSYFSSDCGGWLDCNTLSPCRQAVAPEAFLLLQDGTAESAGHVAAGSRRQSETGRLLQPSAASGLPATSAQTGLHDIDDGERQQPRAPVQPVSSKPGSSGRRLSRGLSRGSSLCSVTELTM